MTSTLQIGGLVLEADWVEAWATVAAAFGTISAFVWQARALNRERKTRQEEIKRLEADQQAGQMAQARTIVLHDPLVGGNGDLGLTKFNITLENFGEWPVTNLEAKMKFIDLKSEQMLSAPAIPRITVLAGGAKSRLSWNLEGFDLKLPSYVSTEVAARWYYFPEVAFTDVHGVRWLCAFNRPAVRLPKPEVPSVPNAWATTRHRVGVFNSFRRQGRGRRVPKASREPQGS